MKFRLTPRLRALLWKDSVEQEIADELSFHLEMRTRELMARGLEPATARTQAERRFGDLQRVAAECADLGHHMERTMRRTQYFDELRRDGRFALRQLRKTPAFTVVAVLTLALGIGATSAVFSLVHGILLKPLPFPESGRLVQVMQAWPEIGLDQWTLSQTNAAVYRERQHSFTALGAYTIRTATLGGPQPTQLNVTYATAGFFEALGIAPLLGRAFLPAEDAPHENHVIILSDALWQQRFGSDPGIVGRTVTIDGFPTQIIGVMPPGFSLSVQRSDGVMPLGLDRNQPWGWFLQGVARLRPGVSSAAAQRELTDIMWGAIRENPVFVGRNQVPQTSQHLHAIVTPLRDALIGNAARPLLVLQAAVGLFLLIAVANVATLLLGRGTSRARELALRVALGASQGRVTRQLLTETLVLALAGAIAGLGLAVAAVHALPHLPIAQLPRAQDVRVDGTVLAFTLLLSVLVSLVFGLAPAFHAQRQGRISTLSGGPRGSVRGSNRRVHGALVVTQLALSVMLLIGAGLVLRSMHRLVALDLGFRPDGITVVNLPLPLERYGSSVPDAGKRINVFVVSLLDRVSHLPGVRGAAVAWGPPFWGSGMNGYRVEGHEVVAGAEGQTVTNAVSPGYFATMQIPLLTGRDFSLSDRVSSAPVAIVDHALAQRFWPEGSAVGHRIQMTGDTTWRTIVGVVGAIRDNTPSAPPMPHTYFPYSQQPGRFVNLEIRTSADPAPVIRSVRQAAAAVEPEVPLDIIQPLGETIRSTMADRRLIELLLGGFALLALLLAAVGIYGVMGLLVADRTREFGIRLAVGAEPASLLRLVLAHGLRLAATGGVLGVAGAFAVTGWIRGLLFEVSPRDPLVFTFLPVGMVAVAVASCYAPSRRAARSDPLAVMRAD